MRTLVLNKRTYIELERLGLPEGDIRIVVIGTRTLMPHHRTWRARRKVNRRQR